MKLKPCYKNGDCFIWVNGASSFHSIKMLAFDLTDSNQYSLEDRLNKKVDRF